jgi:DNA-binding MarR family transcriptional regulator
VTDGLADGDAHHGFDDPHGNEVSEIDPLLQDEAATLQRTGLAIARWWLKARRLREEMFGPDLFADPAWDILLDLYTAAARGESVQISSLAFAARVPHSTAIRWARIMTRAGIVERRKDPADARRVHVSLSPAASALMETYLARLSNDGQRPALIGSDT